MEPAWSPVVVAANTTDVAAVAASPTLKLLGLSIGETAGTAAAAETQIHHGTAASDPAVTAPMNLTADGFDVFGFGGGIPCPNGIFVSRVSGNSEVILYITHS